MKNIMVLGTYCTYSDIAIRRLMSDGIARVTFWSCAPGDVDIARKNWPDVSIIDTVTLARADIEKISEECDIKPVGYDALSPKFVKDMAAERLLLIECMLHRSDYGGMFCLEDMRDTANAHFIIANNIISKYKPDIIYFQSAPHGINDLAAYLLAKKLGIEVLVLINTHIPAVSVAVTDLFDASKIVSITRTERSNEDAKCGFIEASLGSDYKLFYFTKDRFLSGWLGRIKILTRQIRSFVLKAIRTRVSGELIGYQKKRGYPQYEKTSLTGPTKNCISNFRLERLYKSIACTRDDINRIERYAYVSLSYQPEATTLPRAGFMYDQKTYIKFLKSYFSRDIEIVVKEHPTQFHQVSGLQARSARFYKDLQAHGIIFAPYDMTSDELMCRAEFVVVTTGTAGYEALVRHRKPVLSFSRGCWYNDFPGVTVVESPEELKEFARCIMNGEIRFDDGDIKKGVETLKERSLYIWPDPREAKSEGWDEGAMSDNLYQLLRQQLGTVS